MGRQIFVSHMLAVGKLDLTQTKANILGFAVRNTKWRLVNKNELYDISNDPYESKNVIESHPDVVKQLLAEYDTWWEKTTPLMVNEKAPFAKEHPATIFYNRQLKNGGIPDWKPFTE